jgi:hypothetical protein
VEEAPHHLRERQIGKAAPVADRHLAQDGGERGQFFGGARRRIGLVRSLRFASIASTRAVTDCATIAARTVQNGPANGLLRKGHPHGLQLQGWLVWVLNDRALK